MALTKKAQEVVDFLSAEREKFLATAEGLTEAQLNFKPADDHWSIKEIFHHIWMVEGLTARLMAKMLQQATENNFPQDGDPDGSVLGSLAAHAEKLGNKFQAPERVVPLDALPLGDSIVRMTETRTKLLEPLPELCKYDVAELVFPHPALGPINTYQWLLVMGGHEARHRKQIDRVKAHANFPIN